MRPELRVEERLDIASPEFKADPYPAFARLRERSPVHRVTLRDRRPAWLITRYEDVVAALKHPRLVKDRRNAMDPDATGGDPWVPAALRPLMRNMLDLDPPDHTRLRKLVHQAFTPRRIEEMRGRVAELAGELLDSVEGSGSIDLIRGYALPIPTTIIAEVLGVPARDRRRFHRWSSRIVGSSPSMLGKLKVIPAVVAFARYIRRQIRARRQEPRDDLIGALVMVEQEGDRLSEDELMAMIFLLLVAGHETTVNLIGNGMLALLDHPDAMERLRDDPSLLSTGIEELLRYDSPLMTATERYASEEIVIGGVAIPRGDRAFAVIASANRDERQFADPDGLDLSREPNRHLSFGHGIHYCLGASLARLEGRIAIGALLERGADLRLAVARDALRWRPGLVLRGLRNLPITFRPAA